MVDSIPMAQIQTSIERERDLTILTLTGPVAAADVVGALRDFYAGPCTAKALWDFTGSDLHAAKMTDLAAVLTAAKTLAPRRAGGKTALVVPSDLGFGMARMYESMAELKNHPVGHGVFRNREDALHWLAAPVEPD